MKFLALFLLAGIACGLQPQQRFVYQYLGTTSTSIPEISTKGSAVAFRTNVIVTVPTNGPIAFQFENPEFAELTGQLTAAPLSEQLFQFQQIQDRQVAQQLQSVFGVNLVEESQPALVLQQEESLWIVNLKKAVVSTFKNQIIQQNFQNTVQDSLVKIDGQFTQNFNVQEETTFGFCRVQYTVQPLPQSIGQRYFDQTQQQQPQYRKPSLFNVWNKEDKNGQQQQFLQVSRSVDFDSCDINVSLQTSTVQAQGSQRGNQNQGLTGRSSTTEYIFSINNGQFTMEQAKVQGQITSKVFGVGQQLLQSATNQEFQLISVDSSTSSQQVKDFSVQVDTWMQQVISPFQNNQQEIASPFVIFSGKNGQVSDVEVLTQLEDSKISADEKVRQVKQKIQDIAQNMNIQKSQNKQVEQSFQQIRQVVQLLRSVSASSLQQLAQEFLTSSDRQSFNRKMFIDALSAAGTRDAVQVLLQLASQQQLTQIEVITVFTSLQQNLQDVRSISDLIDFVVQERQSPFLSSAALINVARIVNRFCLDQEFPTNRYPSELLGSQGCNVQKVEEQFIPALVNLVNNEDLSFERLVSIFALSELQTPRNVELLAPIVLGQKGQSSMLRETAIFALMQTTQVNETRQAVIDLLTQVYTNIAEEPRLRAAAVQVMSSWAPGPQFWNRLAQQTWTEPSKTMVAQYQALLEIVARTSPFSDVENQAAVRALRIARPLIDRQYMRFQGSSQQTFDNQQRNTFSQFNGFYQSLITKKNFAFYKALLSSVNGIEMNVFEIMSFNGAFGDLEETQHTQYDDTTQFARQANQIFKQIQQAIDFVPRKQQNEDSQVTLFYTRFMENIQILLPLTTRTAQQLPFADFTNVKDLLNQLQNGVDVTFSQFSTPVSQQQFFPNEMGLPVVVSNDFNILFGTNMKVHGAVAERTSQSVLPLKAHVNIDQKLRFATQFSGRIQVLTPWSQSQLMTSVDSTRDVVAPVAFSVDFDLSQQQQSTFEIRFQPNAQNKVDILRATNVPQTAIVPLFSGMRQRSQAIVLEDIQSRPQNFRIPQSFTGFDLAVQFQSQLGFPFQITDLQQTLRNILSQELTSEMFFVFASPTSQFWSFNVEFDPTNSDTKSVVSSLKCGSSVQVETSFDNTFDENEHYNNVQKSKMQKRKTTYDQESNQFMCNAQLSFIGQRQRDYELTVTRSGPKVQTDSQTSKLQFQFTRKPSSNNSNFNSFCIDVKRVSPLVSSLDSVDTLRNKNLKSQVTTTFNTQCERGNPSMTAQTFLEMSQEQFQRVQIQAQRVQEIQPFVSIQDLQDQLVYDQVQTNLQVTEEFQRQVPMSQIIQFIDILLVEDFQQVLMPLIQSSNVQINFRRNPVTALWDLQATDGQTQLGVANRQLTSLVQRIASVDIFQGQTQAVLPLFQNQQSQIFQQQETCFVNAQMIQTFSGSFFNNTNTQGCYTVLTQDCERESFAVLSRQSQQGNQQEVLILDRQNGVVATIGQQTKINGQAINSNQFETIKNNQGQVIAQVLQQDGQILVILPQVVAVTVTDQVQVTVLGQQNVCGVCGNNVGEQQFDFIGPQQCMFEDQELFVYSWLYGGDQCKSSNVQQRRQQVQQYQQQCQTVYDVLERVQYAQYPFMYQYAITSRDNFMCVSKFRQPFCKQSQTGQTQNQQIRFDCWEQEFAPRDLQTAIQSRRQFLQQSVSSQPQQTFQMDFPVYVICQ